MPHRSRKCVAPRTPASCARTRASVSLSLSVPCWWRHARFPDRVSPQIGRRQLQRRPTRRSQPPHRHKTAPRRDREPRKRARARACIADRRFVPRGRSAATPAAARAGLQARRAARCYAGRFLHIAPHVETIRATSARSAATRAAASARSRVGHVRNSHARV